MHTWGLNPSCSLWMWFLRLDFEGKEVLQILQLWSLEIWEVRADFDGNVLLQISQVFLVFLLLLVEEVELSFVEYSSSSLISSSSKYSESIIPSLLSSSTSS